MRLTELKQLKPGTEVVVKRGSTSEIELNGYNLDDINPVIGKTATVNATFNPYFGVVEVKHPDFPSGSYWLSQSWLEFPKAKTKQSSQKNTYMIMYDGEASETFDDLNDFTRICSSNFNLDDAKEVKIELDSGALEIFKMTKVEAKIDIPDPVITFIGF